MKQNTLYTRSNDKTRKDNNSKITNKNTHLTSYNSSKSQAVGIISKITKTNFPHTKHQFQNHKPNKMKNYKIDQHNQTSNTKTSQIIYLQIIPLQHTTIIYLPANHNIQQKLIRQK